jgi:hypothetical protein
MWLDAIERPLLPGAYQRAERFLRDIEGTEEYGTDLIDEATAYVGAVNFGLIVRSWNGDTPPGCPGRDGGPRCDSPVAKGEQLCFPCGGADGSGGVTHKVH